MIIGRAGRMLDPGWRFAWFPTILDDGRVAWLQWVWRYWEDGTFHVSAHYAYALSEEAAIEHHNQTVERSGYYGPHGPGYGQPNRHRWALARDAAANVVDLGA